MSTNLNSSIPGTRGITGEGWAAVAGVVGSAVLLLKKVLTAKGKAEHVTRHEFYAETLATRERINTTHLAALERLDANHREVLAAFERQAGRIAALETGLARVETRISLKARV